MSRPWLCRGFTGLALAAAAACSETMPTTPAPIAGPGDSPSFASTNTVTKYPVLKRTTVLKNDLIVSGWIYPGRNNWQTLKIPGAGLTVSFAPNAVSAPVYVTLVANKGKFVTYEFLPHGTTFSNVRVTQDLHGTDAYNNEAIMSTMFAGYMPNTSTDLDLASGTATFAEEFDVYYYDNTTDYTKTKPSTVRFYTKHFSGYTLASERRTTSTFVDPYAL